jgi:hypothetical protein
MEPLRTERTEKKLRFAVQPPSIPPLHQNLSKATIKELRTLAAEMELKIQCAEKKLEMVVHELEETTMLGKCRACVEWESIDPYK